MAGIDVSNGPYFVTSSPAENSLLELFRRECYASRATRQGGRRMRILGFMLLLAGWAIVVCALALLQPAPRVAFVLAGMGVEVLGLVLVIRSHPLLRGEE
jgi:hypothetical protein